MKLHLLALALSISGAFGAIGSICKDSDGRIGTCQKTSWCNSNDGTIKSNLCPYDPNDVKCCFSPKCNSRGVCQNDGNYCSGYYSTGDCPGPKTYRCCNRTGKPIPIM